MTVSPAQTTDTPCQTTILVVDDNLVDRRKAGGIVEQCLGWRVLYAEHGLAALAAIERDGPQIVLTDLQMPEMNGLELVEAVKSKYPLVPVVLMTAYGSEDIAIQALRQGAASYVPKQRLARELADILDQVLAAASAERRLQQAFACLTDLEAHFQLENDPTLVRAFVTLAQRTIIGLLFYDDNTRIRLAVALEEALTNALYHGNLQVSSELRQHDDRAYYKLAEERRQQAPYRDRRLHVEVKVSQSDVSYIIRDDGPGFDSSTLPDPTDPANLEKPSGRGLLLIQTFMDKVCYNDTGNQITMLKHRGPASR